MAKSGSKSSKSRLRYGGGGSKQVNNQNHITPPPAEIKDNRYVFATATPNSAQYPNTKHYIPPIHPPYYRYPPPPPATPFPAPYYDHHRMAMDPAKQVLVGGRYPCGHEQSVSIKNEINIKKETLKIKPDQEDPERYLVEFTYDASIAGRITLHFFEKWGENYNMNPTEELLPPITVVFQQGLGQKYVQESRTGINLSVYKVGIPEVYHLGIKAQATPCISQDGSSNSGTTIFQLTLAVFEKKKGECQIRVTNQILWVNGVEYVLHDICGFGNFVDGGNFDLNALVKNCFLCLSTVHDTTLLSGHHHIAPQLHHNPRRIYEMPKNPANLCVNLNERRIGKLLFYNKEIGRGSNGTIVLKGYYDGREVAVKRIVMEHYDVALKEIQNLIVSDQHPNIVRLYGVEYDQDFVYIALERCVCSLHDLILSLANSSVELQPMMKVFKDLKLWECNGYPSPLLLKVMRDTVRGLVHLHKHRIIHSDLKPENILIHKDTSISAKVSDMGISKRLSTGKSSLTKSTTGIGSSGWQPPERLLNKEGQTSAVDLFSLGCLIFFCITHGRHPFGKDKDGRDGRIKKGEKSMSLVKKYPEAHDLISRLLDPDPKSRPKAVEVYHHPLFWDPDTRLSFLRDASDRIELEDRKNDSDILKSLKSIGDYTNWDKKLHKRLIKNIEHHREYNYDDVCDLLRAIRNKYNHYGQLSKKLQRMLGEVPTKFDGYFSSRFPKLVIETYNVLKGYSVEGEILHKYYKQYQF
ncbi:hypothetical protein Lser_V15G40425 [Lactuca serriola]